MCDIGKEECRIIEPENQQGEGGEMCEKAKDLEGSSPRWNSV